MLGIFAFRGRRGAIGAALCGAVLVTACGGSAFSSDTGSTTNGGNAGDGGSSSGAGGSGTGGSGAGGSGTGGSGAGGLHGSGGGPGSGGVSAGGGTSTGGGPGAGGTVSTGGAVGTGGSGGDSTQYARDYFQKCNFDYECTLVTEGEVCGCPGCANASVATSAQTQWDTDRAKIQSQCPLLPINCPAIDCAQRIASCGDGLCYARNPLYVSADEYDASCHSDSDCVVIFTGEVCNSCQCGTAGVNKDAYQQYLADVKSVKCSPGPSACDCAPQMNVTCKLGPDPSSPGVCTVGF
ncbi:MAG TPA: hypothetical protein VHE30_19320 [Polyangiaceae bacterium]|nr:hypothetical protein [Polyangiaceae bacterium]